jgi:c(7)-type cytochrome triheme protein
MNTATMLRAALGAALLALAASAATAADLPNGKAIYDATCAACHSAGVAGAPKPGDSAAWSARLKGGIDALVASAVKGKNVMPPRGGNPKLSDPDLRAAIEFMSGPGAPKASAAPPAKAAAAAAPPAAPALPAGAGVNTFNRLMKPPAQRNLPPPEDGIHDPSNDGTHALQAPLAAFGNLAKSNDGNRIDWVKALSAGAITPRFDRNDPSAQPMVMDMNIVREVKGSMPDVVYPHKQHTEWLDCSNCHPAIFIPQKGANQISMASILLGQKCGVCHGKVAFPVSDCRRCHSKSKAPPVTAAAKP